MLFPICRTAVVAPRPSQKLQHSISRLSCWPPPTIIPLRDCGLEIKEWRAASYSHLTQSLITLAYLFPLSILTVGPGRGSLLPLSKVGAGK